MQNKFNNILKELLSRFDQDILLKSSVLAIVKDLQPDLHPSYHTILMHAVDSQLMTKLNKFKNQNNEFEVLNLRTQFKENNGFDDRAYEVFDAFCEGLNIEIRQFLTIENSFDSEIKEHGRAQITNNLVNSKVTNSLSINNKITSSDLKMLCDSNGAAIGFLNQYKFKKTDSWRYPTSDELKSEAEELRLQSYKLLWCRDSNTNTISIFNVEKGTHEKCNNQQQLQQLLPLLAICDLKYSSIIDRELAVHINTTNEWGLSIVYGALGEHTYPESFLGSFNKFKLHNKSNWRLPSIIELGQLYKHRESLNLSPELPVWSSTEPKKFFVNVLDFQTGEISEWKKYANAFDKRRGTIILISN
ncbi:hypothetical protein [Psychroflexus salis]|uniref:DUF1566 domain-containing protein n=1 Tax=Psychroflexus salis TaxID=1526574 RepID=A0A916ZW33_9FLAO|nr:hypothetical protein [Psychroflexus salis]GGE15536.1 hypothetical protein GCM10010831_16080 [Psychroflexus salis]